MELHLSPEAEAKLNELSLRTQRGTDELMEEAVDHLVSYNEWLEEKVKRSMSEIDRGHTISDEDVRSWLERSETGIRTRTAG